MRTGLMLFTLLAIAPHAFADVQPVASHVQGNASIQLTPLNLTDGMTDADDQLDTLGNLGIVLAEAGMDTHDGSFYATVNAAAGFNDASSGWFSSNSGYEGALTSKDPAATGFIHSATSFFHYDFHTTDPGMVTIDGSLFNGGNHNTDFVVRVRYFEESAPGAGFTSSISNDFYDPQNDGETFSISHELASPTGNYRIEVQHIHFGNTAPEIPLGTSTLGGTFVIELQTCDADFTGDGTLDIFDVFAFLDAFESMDASADFTGDGAFDIFDVFAFLDAFTAGCP